MKTPTKIAQRMIALATAVAALSLPARAAGPNDRARARALAEAAAGHWTAAEPVLQRLAAAEPTDVAACAQLARHRLQQHQAKAAVELLEKAVAAAPRRADLQAQLGNALAQRIGQVAFIHQAIIAVRMRRAYQTAVALDPNNLNGWIGLAQYYANAPAIAGGSLAKAREYAHEVEKRDPYQGALQFGIIDARAGDGAAAAAQYRRAAGLRPQDAWPWILLGQTEAKGGRPAEARQAFAAALKRQPDCAPAQRGLAELDAKSGK